MSYQSNAFKIYFDKVLKRPMDDEPLTLQMNCELCNRKNKAKRKNKVYYDESRCLEIETGTITVLKKKRIVICNTFYQDQLDIYLCQDCITRINLSEAAYILLPISGICKGRFLRKNELITDSFKLITITENKPSKPYITPDFHYKDALDYYLYVKYGNSLTQ